MAAPRGTEQPTVIHRMEPAVKNYRCELLPFAFMVLRDSNGQQSSYIQKHPVNVTIGLQAPVALVS